MKILLSIFILAWLWLGKYFYDNYRRANRKLALDRKAEEAKRAEQDRKREEKQRRFKK